MIFVWCILAIAFLIIELMTFTFGFIFMSLGAVIITLLLGLDIIANTDFLYQFLIMLFFGVLSFVFFYRSFKKSKANNQNNYQEDMMAVVIDKDLILGQEGKIKWSGTICNAMIDKDSNIKKINVGDNVVIKKFKGNIAIVNKNL